MTEAHGNNARTCEAARLMAGFAQRTGLDPARDTPQRYLWTDAFAVCNYIALYGRSKDGRYLSLAGSMIHQVHRVLGRHRADDRRQGWISGLEDEVARHHPTAGGLRIGKPLPERRAGEPFDERLEWERDGQYFHYLTKWMHALWRFAAVSSEPEYLRYARELARTAFAKFAMPEPRGGPDRLAWKMNIDLTAAQVGAVGLHDPLDGYVTFRVLQTAGHFGTQADFDLDPEIEQLHRMLGSQASFASDDPLGVGGLLFDACRLVQLGAAASADDLTLAERLLRDAASSLRAGLWAQLCRRPAGSRLGFRELGLAIGLEGLPAMIADLSEQTSHAVRGGEPALAEFERYASVAEEIEAFWLDPVHREAEVWREHQDINEVMLASVLLPEGLLGVESAAGEGCD